PAPTPAKHKKASAPTPPPAPASKARAKSGELSGRIQFRAGGSAFVILENPDGSPGNSSEPSVQIFPEDTAVALPGDRVVIRMQPGRKGRRPGEKIGSVVRVLERGRNNLVGNLARSGRHFT